MWGMSGSDEDIRLEMSKFSANQTTMKEETIRKFHEDWDKCLQEHYVPIPFEEVLDCVELNTGVGRPWKEFHATKRDMIDSLGLEVFLDYLRSVEESIVDETAFPDVTFDVFSKLDKYKLSKIENNRLRTIQGGDFVYLCLLIRWTYRQVKDLYANHPRFLVVFNNQDFGERVTKAFEGKHTVGLDATGFDRSVPTSVIFETCGSLLERTDCPEAMKAFITCTAAFGRLQAGDGRLEDRYGGNPSGIFLTTILNCAFNDMMHIEAYTQLFGENFEDHVQWVLTGDDSLDGYNHETPLEPVLDAFSNFCLEFKCDTFEVEGRKTTFPPGIGCHAPYLARVSVVRQGVIIPVPAEPRRNLGWYHTHDPIQSQLEKRNSLIGIRESVMPYYAVELLDPSYPIPESVQSFMDYFDRQGYEGSFMDAQKALEVYGTLV
jgi:hypothetical protein